MAQANVLQITDPREELFLRARREHAAGKLAEKVPALVSLRLSIVEARSSGWHGGGYARHIDLKRALALFEFPCSYAHCQDGGYDLTGDLIGGLRLRRARFEGRHACVGRCGSVNCTRLMFFEAKATYLPQPDAAVEAPPLDPFTFAPRAASGRFR
jgi:hypothetical protein